MVAALLVVGALGLPTVGRGTGGVLAHPGRGLEHQRPRVRGAHRRRHRLRRRRLHPGARPGRQRRPSARSRLAAFDVHTGALRTGLLAPTRTASCARSRPTAPACSSAGRSPRSRASAAAGSPRSTSRPATVNTGFSANANSHVYALRVNQTPPLRRRLVHDHRRLEPQPDRRGLHRDRRGRPDLQPEREQHGARASSCRPTAPASTPAGTSPTIGGGSAPLHRDALGHDRRAAAADVPVLDVRRRSSTSTSRRPATGSTPRSATSRTRRSPGAPAAATGSGSTRSTATPRRSSTSTATSTSASTRAHIGDDTVRMLVADAATGAIVADLPPADQQLLRRVGHRRDRRPRSSSAASSPA